MIGAADAPLWFSVLVAIPTAWVILKIARRGWQPIPEDEDEEVEV